VYTGRVVRVEARRGVYRACRGEKRGTQGV
jgi:hypothetical protein